jgi:hypothetical protein
MYGPFTLRRKPREPFSCFENLFVEAFRFDYALGVNSSGAFAFARQSFGLLRQTFERRFQLAADFHQALCDGRVR